MQIFERKFYLVVRFLTLTYHVIFTLLNISRYEKQCIANLPRNHTLYGYNYNSIAANENGCFQTRVKHECSCVMIFFLKYVAIYQFFKIFSQLSLLIDNQRKFLKNCRNSSGVFFNVHSPAVHAKSREALYLAWFVYVSIISHLHG